MQKINSKEKYLLNFRVALEGIRDNKLRSFLTALGIIFGVAAVISMLAIGNGAQQEILEQIKLVGVNNILIEPVVKQEEGEVSENNNGKKGSKKEYSPGLTMMDAKSIASVLPVADRISPEIIIETNIVRKGFGRTGKLVGVTNNYFDLTNFDLLKGSFFNEKQMRSGGQVCVIGKAIATKFFSDEDPIGKYIKCGSIWLKVIGVLQERLISDKARDNLGIRNYNMDVYAPIQTVLIRYKNRALVTKSKIERAIRSSNSNNNNEEQVPVSTNYHQLDKLTVNIKETNALAASADVISRMLKRRHEGVVDFEVTVPELLLKQQQKTKDIFNIVLGAIAGISLLVGGIGIMNIMLASVMERIKEIGLRQALGATKEDIIAQFLLESVLISLSGGIVGIFLGVAMAGLISYFTDINTIISAVSIIVSFCVAAGVGLIFGIMPAKRAADQNPIKSLRHE